MKITLALLIVFLLIPISVYADCSETGATVIFINGILGNKESAINDKDLLKKEFFNYTKRNDVNFINGFNDSHIGGFGDLWKSTQQAYEGGYIDYDLTNIIHQMHTDLKTRKVLLVGHSQGTFYTNSAYEYLIKNGVPKESIAVYNVGTPADIVAGDGNYLTSSTDKLINEVVRKLIEIGSARKPLPANIDIALEPSEAEKPLGGHSFSGVYLKSVPEKIIGDMKGALDNLSVNNYEPLNSGCFNPPKITLSHKFKGLGFLMADASSKIISGAASLAYKKSLAWLQNAYSLYNIGQSFASNLVAKVNKNLFGASLILTLDDKNNLDLPTGDLVLAENEDLKNQNLQNQPIITEIIQKDSKQEEIDDILEKIDILKQQIIDLELAEKSKNLPKADIALLESQNTQQQRQQQPNNNIQTASYSSSGGNGSSGGNPIYPKILISEVQIGGLTDSKQEFVELYNPNSQDIDLTSWYLQRKTKTGSNYSTFAPNTSFSGKKIAAQGYFLIARQGYFSNLADIFIDNPLTEDNSLVLKNPNGDISDKVGWGQAQDYELSATISPDPGKSIGRKIVAQEPNDTDINFFDFEIGNPTPKAKNVAYVKVAEIPVAPKDDKSPEVIFTLNAKQDALSFSINFIITDPLGAVSPSGIEGYIFRWREENGNWQEDAYININEKPATFPGARDFIGIDEKNYYFQIKAKDAAGNESDWQPENYAITKISVPKKILINEIQIDGKKGSGGAEDDWVELHNPNNFDVDLGEWSIQKHSSDDPCSINKSYFKKNFTSGSKISANGFFLIANTNSSENLKNIADMTTSWSLSNNNTIYLSRAKDKITDGNDMNIIDKVGFGDEACFFENNPAPKPPEEKSIERKKLGLDTDNNLDDFKISDEPTPKGTFPKTTIQDATDYLNNPNSNSPGAPTYSFLLKWNSLGANIDFYHLQYKLNGDNWKDWLAQTSKTEEYFQGFYSLFNDNVYQFRARAQDKGGSLGDWVEITIDATNPVVINEVAYAGTNASPSDQWIELYNRTDKNIDLTDWKIVSGHGLGLNGKDTLNLKLKGTILAKGHFILEMNDNVLSDVSADQLFSKNDSIGKNYLYLRNQNNRYIDEFYMPPSGLDENNFIKDGNHYSSERVSPYSFGMSDKNWKINDGEMINGKDREENQIYGTPGRQNSVNQMYTYYSSSFIQDTTLKKELSPYLFKGMDVSVFKDINLTIEPGVVVKFYDNQSKLQVNGTLKAIGKDDGKIIFTSFKDDKYGQDANDDQDQSLPEAGNWLSLYFSPESKNSELENVVVRYGGAVFGSFPLGFGNAIWVDKSSISIKNSVVEKNRNRALMLTDSSSIIDNVKFLDNSMTDWPPGLNESKAIYIQGGKPEIKNSYFENNSQGIYIYSFYDEINQVNIEAMPKIENNNFVKNGDPIYFGPLSYPVFTNNQATDNQFNAIIFASDISKDMNLKPDLPYLVKNISIVPENTTLTLEPGVIMEFQSNWSGLQIDGALKAVGEAISPIIFRSYYYNNPEVLPGNWLGLRFTKTGKNSELENVDISYGGAFYGHPQNQDFTAAIKIDQSSILLKNSIVHNNANNGIWLVNSPSIIDSVQFLDQSASTVLLQAKGIYVEGGSPEIKNSNFENNYYGIYIGKWNDPDTGEDILGEPILENNQFEGNVKDIFP